MKKKLSLILATGMLISLFSCESKASTELMRGMTFHADWTKQDDGTYEDSNWSIKNDGANEVIIREGNTLTWKTIDGEVLSTKAQSDTGDYSKKLDNGVRITKRENTLEVLLPYFDDVYNCCVTTVNGEKNYFDGYVVFENGVIHYYNYDGTPSDSDAKYEYKDGKFFWNGQEEELSFTSGGFSCTDSDGNVYSYTRWFDGVWYYAEDGISYQFSIHNGVLTIRGANGAETGYVWYLNGNRGCEYDVESYVFDKVRFEDGRYVLIDESGKEYSNDALLLGKWKISAATHSDGSSYSADALDKSTFGFVFETDGTGVETVANTSYTFIYSYDVMTGIISVAYPGSDKQPITLRMSADCQNILWEYSNTEFEEYMGEAYTFARTK